MPSIRTGVGTILETKPYSIWTSSQGSNSITVTLSQAYSNVKYALQASSDGSDALAVWYRVNGQNVTISARNFYSSGLGQSGELIVYQTD